MAATAIELWDSSRSAERTLATAYCAKLGLDPAADMLRFNLSSRPVGAPSISSLPAVVFPFFSDIDAGKTIVGVERHFLDPDTGEFVRQDFVGSATAGYWLVRPLAQQNFTGTLCVTQGVDRALKLGRQMNCVTAAVHDLASLRSMTFAPGIYQISIDGEGLDEGTVRDILGGLRAKAYLCSVF